MFLQTDAPQTDMPHVHSFTDEVTPASCITEGKIVEKCSCGETKDELVSARVEHSFDSSTKWSVSNGVYSASSGCAFCGKNSISESDTPAFSVDFESSLSDVATKYEGFRIVKPDNYGSKTVEANGSLGLKVVGSASNLFYIDVDAQKLLELGTASISFDMTLLTDGTSGKEPSLFSLLGNFQNGAATGTTKWGWMFKFKNDDGKLETTQGKPLNDTIKVVPCL